MVKHFNEALFQEYPVWKWDDTTEWHLPIQNHDPLPDDEVTLFISARFETADGHRFTGYLIGSDGFYAFGLFVGGKEYVLNLNLPEMIDESLAEIGRVLGTGPIRLFPLRYETDVHFAGRPNLSGTLKESK